MLVMTPLLLLAPRDDDEAAITINHYHLVVILHFWCLLDGAVMLCFFFFSFPFDAWTLTSRGKDNQYKEWRDQERETTNFENSETEKK
jgi:hypothetical protein